LLKIAIYDKVNPMEIIKKQFTPVKQDERKNLVFKAGDTVRVWNKIIEKGKTRLQAFEGLVLCRKHGTEAGATFTIRKVTSGVGVERIFPLFSPNIDRIEVMRKSKTRRSKLYYIRDKAVKEVKKRLKSVTISNDKEIKDLTTDDEKEKLENTVETENEEEIEKTTEVEKKEE
jgi:large subunit ribosomal protein L19